MSRVSGSYVFFYLVPVLAVYSHSLQETLMLVSSPAARVANARLALLDLRAAAGIIIIRRVAVDVILLFLVHISIVVVDHSTCVGPGDHGYRSTVFVVT